MWTTSTAMAAQLGQTHTAVTRVDVLHGGRNTAILIAVDGDVNAEIDRPVTRNMNAVLADPTGELSGGDIDDLLSPYNCEVAAYRGVVLPGGALEYCPLGVFGLTARDVNAIGSVSVTGQDRSIIYQGGMTGTLAIPGNTAVEAAIARLLSTRNQGVQMATWVTKKTCGPLLYAPDVDVWAEAQSLAQSVGGTLAHDRLGFLHFSPGLPTSRRAVRRWAAGDGLLLDVQRTEDVDTIHNVVVVQSAKTDAGAVIQAVAEDTDPRSPTYSRGSYGRRVGKPIVNPHISSQAQAAQVAAAELARELGRSETVQAEVVVDPRIDPLDVVTLHYPEKGLRERGMVVASVTVPFLVTDSMSVTFRKSTLAADGRVLDTADVVTPS